MTTTELLPTFANPELMKSLTMGDRLSAGLVTTILGMGITFSALVILLIMISWMNKILNKSPADRTAPIKTAVQQQTVKRAITPDKSENDNELVAVITTAIAMTLKTPASNIVIKNIARVSNQSPQWKRAGVIDQMNSRL